MRFLNLLIRVHFSLILTLVFDKIGVIFSVLGILLFIDGMHPASVLAVAMGMVHLDLAIVDKTLGQLGDAVGNPNVDIKRIDIVIDGWPALGKVYCIAFDIKGWPHKQAKVL